MIIEVLEEPVGILAQELTRGDIFKYPSNNMHIYMVTSIPGQKFGWVIIGTNSGENGKIVGTTGSFHEHSRVIPLKQHGAWKVRPV